MAAVKKSAEIAAPPEKILAIMLDVEDHHNWQKEVQSIEILEKDDQGRPSKTKVAVSAMGQEATYSLQYAYPDANSFTASLLEGDLMTESEMEFSAVPKGEGSEVSISQEMKIKWPLPGFMIDQLTLKGVKDMLKALDEKATA